MQSGSNYMKLRLNDDRVEIWYGDDSGACCGENRTDWSKVAVINAKELEALLKGNLDQLVFFMKG